jgi:hypothetical protein
VASVTFRTTSHLDANIAWNTTTLIPDVFSNVQLLTTAVDAQRLSAATATTAAPALAKTRTLMIPSLVRNAITVPPASIRPSVELVHPIVTTRPIRLVTRAVQLPATAVAVRQQCEETGTTAATATAMAHG